MKKKGERPREKFLKPFANKQREPVRCTGTLNLQFTIYNFHSIYIYLIYNDLNIGPLRLKI